MHPAIETYNKARDTEAELQIIEKQKLRRQIEDYLRKYSSFKQLQAIAKLINLKGETK